MAFTHTAPIGIENINTTFYVAGVANGGFSTIQAAIDYVRLNFAGVGDIVICQGHQYNEDIPSLTGGSAGMVIIDQRQGVSQRYKWDGTKFVPLDFVQLGGLSVANTFVAAPSSMSMVYHPLTPEIDNAGSGGIIVNGNAGATKKPFFYVNLRPGDGVTPEFSIFQCGEDQETGVVGVTIAEDVTVLGHLFAKGDIMAETNCQGVNTAPVQGMKLTWNLKNGFGETDFINSYGLGGGAFHWYNEPPNTPMDSNTVPLMRLASDARLHVLNGIETGGEITAGGNLEVGGGLSVHDHYIAADGSMTMVYHPEIGAENGSGGIIVNGNAGKGIPFFYVNLRRADTEEEFSIFQCGAGPDGVVGVNLAENVTVAGSLWIGQNDALTNSRGVWIKSKGSISDIQGESIPAVYDQTIRINHLGGNVEIALQSTTTTGDLISTDAKFDTCLVANSPVRTIANSPYPPTGIPQSTGSAWGASINPATLQGKLTVTTTGTSGPSTLVGNTLNIPQYAGTSGGMVYPDAGIGVSTGTAWGVSIDPATIAHTDAANTFTQGQTVNGEVVVTGSITVSNGGLRIGNDVSTTQPTIVADTGRLILNPSATHHLYLNWFTGTGTVFGNGAQGQVAAIDTKGTLMIGNSHLAIYDGGTTANPGFAAISGDGINVTIAPALTGSILHNYGSGASNGHTIFFDGATNEVARIAKTGDISTLGWLHVDKNISTGLTVGNQGVTLGWNLSSGSGETDFINSKGAVGGGFSWYNAAGGATVTSATAPNMKLDSGSNLNLIGELRPLNGAFRILSRTGTLTGSASLSADATNAVLNSGATGSVYLNYDQGNAGTKFGNGAGGVVASIDQTGNGTFNSVTTQAVAAPAVGGNIEIDPRSTGSVLLNWTSSGGTGQVVFGNGAAGLVGSVDRNGNAGFSGTVTAAGKTFRIPHPLDETKDLVHSCLEGPEWGVYYRGEVVTANGTAEVTLPDYFEALTFPEDRSVQLTQVFEDGAVLTMLAATRIVDGKFTVHSSAPIATVAWQVNAVRRFGENKLEVVSAKVEPFSIPEATPTPAPVEESKGATKNVRRR